MKLSLHLFLLFLLSTALTAQAQTPATDASTGDETPPPNSTVITSDELRSDQESHVAVYTGNVTVIGNSFNMKCNEMTVYFTKDNKVDHIVATGNVVITQPGRITHSGHVEYFRDEDKFVLTDQPNILDHKDQLFAPTIIIYRSKQTLKTEGPTKTILIQDAFSSSSDSSIPATSTDTK